jgi:hypothetical protein
VSSESTSYDGGCLYGFVRYRMTTKPLIVHCCHCRSCQRQTGSAFALNALIEPDRVQLLQGEVEVVDAPSDIGMGQKISHCPKGRIPVGSTHAETAVWFVHVGTLDEPDRMPPDVHVFTASKQPWLLLPPDSRASTGLYNPAEVWRKESLQRRAEMLAGLQQR